MPVAGAADVGETADTCQMVLAACWFFVLGVCVNLVISGGLAMVE
jgi:hypothetical protein